MIIKYIISVFFWQFFNPFGYWQSLLQNAAQFWENFHIGKIQLSHNGVIFSTPFEGEWLVARGGIDRESSHSWGLIAQRFAYDFIFSDEHGRKSLSPRSKVTEHPAFGRGVLAPADGVVHKVCDQLKDRQVIGSGTVDILAKSMLGNYVVIRHASHCYSLIAHLKHRSCKVKKGDFVKRGDCIGQCGNSGHSTQPHIHIQVQNTPNIFFTIGLPVQFGPLEISNGKENTQRQTGWSYSRTGMKIRRASAVAAAEDAGTEIGGFKFSGFIFINSLLNVLGLLVWAFFIVLLVVMPGIRVLLP